jgi:hypothetical protein
MVAVTTPIPPSFFRRRWPHRLLLAGLGFIHTSLLLQSVGAEYRLAFVFLQVTFSIHVKTGFVINNIPPSPVHSQERHTMSQEALIWFVHLFIFLVPRRTTMMQYQSLVVAADNSVHNLFVFEGEENLLGGLHLYHVAFPELHPFDGDQQRARQVQ